MKRSNTSSASSQPRLMRSLPLIAVLAMLISLGCSDSMRDSSDSTQRIAKGDDGQEMGGEMGGETPEEPPNESTETLTIEPGLGGRGGLALISADVPIGCVAYPVSDRLLLTAPACVRSCRSSDDCMIAVMRDSAIDPEYYGLGSRTYLVESAGAQLGLIELESLRDWGGYTIASEVPEQLSVLGESSELSASRDAELELSGVPALACDYLGLGAFNERRQLVGIRGDADQCYMFTAITALGDALERAISGDLSGAISIDELPQETEEPIEETDRDDEEERAREAERLEREVTEAEARAPASCIADDPSYCDGDVELRCVNGAFVAFHCGSVGWQCTEDADWGAGCYP